MRRLPKKDYVHRGDRDRRRRRIRQVALAVGLIGSAAFLPREKPRDANASVPVRAFGLKSETQTLREQLDAVRGELELATAQLHRANALLRYAGRYKVDPGIAEDIYDVALAEGIDPELAFRVVKVESNFNPRATSPVGALGLTQVMPATAQYFHRGVTREQLYDRKINLRVGFRYLRTLIREYKGDVRLALLVYNRGPKAVHASLAAGTDPRNGYERIVLKGYRGKGVVD